MSKQPVSWYRIKTGITWVHSRSDGLYIARFGALHVFHCDMMSFTTKWIT